jgi:hypothetical protein
VGGVRNWDYRYLGYYDDARAWRDWLMGQLPAVRAKSKSCTVTDKIERNLTLLIWMVAANIALSLGGFTLVLGGSS